MLHWKYLPAVLASDELYDRDGCLSGSAVTLSDGRRLLMYTGVSRILQKNGGVADVQTQSLAVGNAMDYEKYTDNPVLDVNDIPEGASANDFRDPKMWECPDFFEVGGKQVIIATIYTKQSADQVSFVVNGRVKMNFPMPF